MKSNLLTKEKNFQTSILFSFESKSPINWKAGQHGIFSFKNAKLDGRNSRLFSVASCSDEKIITIATNIGENPSEFKTKLKSMEIGDSISLRGPFGGFFISDYTKDIALIAGGIGITPMRSILKGLEYKNVTGKVTLFYIDSKKEYVFKDELDQIENNSSNISILYLADRKKLR